jgi:hypothetical protein
MSRRIVSISIAIVLPVSLSAQGTATLYPTMAPVEQYRMDRAAEVALAKTAAPASISDAAEVLVLGASGYETAVPGKNGFVCVVQRSWANDFSNQGEFWNPKVRAPLCFNAAAAQSVLPDYLARTKQALTGMAKAKMQAASLATKPANGSMVYMLSKEGYLGDNVNGPWHPHLMLLFPRTPDAAWGANAAQSPVLEFDAPNAPFTTFLVPLSHWSDGSVDSAP